MVDRAVHAARGRDSRRQEYMEKVKKVLALTRQLSVDIRDVMAATIDDQQQGEAEKEMILQQQQQQQLNESVSFGESAPA